jgi:hypothetical protein
VISDIEGVIVSSEIEFAPPALAGTLRASRAPNKSTFLRQLNQRSSNFISVICGKVLHFDFLPDFPLRPLRPLRLSFVVFTKNAPGKIPGAL